MNKKLFHLINDESADEKRPKGVERAGRDTKTGGHQSRGCAYDRRVDDDLIRDAVALFGHHKIEKSFITSTLWHRFFFGHSTYDRRPAWGILALIYLLVTIPTESKPSS